MTESSTIGVMASLVTPLAEAGISVFVRATVALRAAGHKVALPPSG
jgi:hypothetical protein